MREKKVDCLHFLDKGCLCLNDLLKTQSSCGVSGEGSLSKKVFSLSCWYVASVSPHLHSMFQINVGSYD